MSTNCEEKNVQLWVVVCPSTLVQVESKITTLNQTHKVQPKYSWKKIQLYSKKLKVNLQNR